VTLSQRRRQGRAAAVAAVAALTVSACSFTSPRQTTEPYPPSDGTVATIDLADGNTVTLHNMLVVAEEEGGPGRVIGAVEVTGARAVSVDLAADFGEAQPAAPATVDVEPGRLTILGPDDEDVVLPSVAAPPGAFLQMTATTAEGGTTAWSVPVLRPVYPYEGLAPEAAPTG
jgi:hypothetical protein